MRIGEFVRIVGLMVCMVGVVQACQREHTKTPPAGQKGNQETMLNGLKDIILPPIAPEVKEWLGSDLLPLVSAPETITSYRITPKKDTSRQNVAGYPIEQNGAELTPEQRVRLQWLLLDQQSYRTGALKKCLFLPEYAFTLHKGESDLNVLVSMSCAQIQFLTGEKKLLRDCDPALPKLQEFIENIFPQSQKKTVKPTPTASQIQEIAPAVSNMLAGPVFDALTQPEQVTVYQISPKKQAAAAQVQGYPVVKQGADMTPEQMTTLQASILAESSYRFETVKKCLFLPEYALVVTRQKTDVTLLFDFNCGQVKFLGGASPILKDLTQQGRTNVQTLLTNIVGTP